MSDGRLQFPLPFLDARAPEYMASTHWLLVLQGTSLPPGRPLYSRDDRVCDVVVDEQGGWGLHEWTTFAQKHDYTSPWLACTPRYGHSGPITHTIIHRDMIVRTGKTEGQKEMYLFTAEPNLRNKLRDYAKDAVARAEESLEDMRLNVDLSNADATQIVWPTVIIDRATYLWKQLVAGVPSVNSFKRGFASLRRFTLELEGFVIWASVMKTPVGNRPQVARAFRDERQISYRGAFLHGSQSEWVNETSQLRRAYLDMKTWGAPVFALVRRSDWEIQRLERLVVPEVITARGPIDGER